MNELMSELQKQTGHLRNISIAVSVLAVLAILFACLAGCGVFLSV